MLVRYADDAVVFAKSEGEIYQAKVKLKTFLQERGLNLSEEKTKTYHIREGFDFLGFNIKQYPSSNKKKGIVILTKPSKQSVKEFKKQMTLAWKRKLSWGTSRMIEELNLKLKGWASYFRSGASNRTFHNLDYWLWNKQIWYTRRRHPNKTWQWCKDKYWGKIMARNDKWVFMDKEEGYKQTYLWKLSWTSIKRHVMVKGRHSPDDPGLKQYWEERQKRRNPYWHKTRGILWRRQVGKCRVCLANIDNGEKVEVHHVLPKRLGGNDHIDNLAMLHVTCHRQVHYELRKDTTDVSELLEPYAG